MSCFQRASEQKTNLYCVRHWDQPHNKTREETMISRINFGFLLQLVEADTMIQLKSELLKILRQRLDNLEVKGQQHSDPNVHPSIHRFPFLGDEHSNKFGINFKNCTLPETNMAPENWWLEY